MHSAGLVSTPNDALRVMHDGSFIDFLATAIGYTASIAKDEALA